ncbi:4-hydroxy-tetrahydrodipicolinate synthase, partial [bacterium]
MISFALKGDFAKACPLHYKLLELTNAMFEEGNPSGIKALLEVLKIAPNNLRLPLVPVSEKLYSRLELLAKKLK